MVDWQEIETVLLDMDGTLLDLHFDSHFWLEHLPLRYAEIHQLDPDEARNWLHERIVQEQGHLHWYCIDYWTRELNVPINALKLEVADRIAFRPHVQDFLAELKQQKIRSVIVTNAHQDSLMLKIKHTGLDQLVDKVICSHDLGLPKEDPRFWDQLLEVEPFDAAHTLLVDDSLPVLQSARQYGIRYLLSIYQPDSEKPHRQIDEFAAIHHFNEIFPDKTR
ncbi:GMP/IMP nucleotidase [Neptuniibacter sp. CAU 1671]|uniref:GMP/IMP nucleotidase n=1 Tax=Neptuniibacter sp. CAU 1671 TaxID=3032593 RepID=UPI0023DB192F|nr:GMP/IMP nucleotidase [Neptuniibacter sp. CAU 1671]MDF2182624.1 GMP/IMP nucleotidase [Neptuniibacter sp. CAU 1671]